MYSFFFRFLVLLIYKIFPVGIFGARYLQTVLRTPQLFLVESVDCWAVLLLLLLDMFSFLGRAFGARRTTKIKAKFSATCHIIAPTACPQIICS